MISDGIENCLRYIDNFDPEKSSNPFAYFTQIIYYAFIRRIQREKKQTILKCKIIAQMESSMETYDIQDVDHENQSFSRETLMPFMNSNIDELLKKDEEREIKAKAKKKNRHKATLPLDEEEDIRELLNAALNNNTGGE
jgi:DNA-directed RNA polymerase specialized sigma24 family protein